MGDGESSHAGECKEHGLRTGPDGKCVVCRREQGFGVSAAQQEDSGIGGRVALALVVVGLMSIWYFSATSEPVDRSHKGPSTEDLIAVLDEQIEELERYRKQGELGPGGLQRLSQLEDKRARLEALRRMKEENRD